MSGQPVKTPSDINRFRDKYMDTLKMQEDINQMNLQANKTYLLTGQLPPQSQMQDTRTTAEKLADVEKLKQDIASTFKPIAEPSFSYAIVSNLMEQPLNANNSLIRFLAQRASSIVEQLKKILPYGIAGDANDLERIVEYIKNLYSDTQGKFQTTKSYMNSISTGSSSSKVISANDIDSVLIQLTDTMKQINIITQRGNANFVNLIPITTRIIAGIQDIKNTLPTTQELDLFIQDMENPALNTGISRGELDAIFKLLEKLPKYNEVIALINKINQYISSNNINAAEDGLNRMINLFSFMEDPNFDNLKNIFRGVKGVQRTKINNMEAQQSIQERQMIRMQSEAERDQSKAQKVYIINPANDAVYIRNANAVGNNGAMTAGVAGATGAVLGAIGKQAYDVYGPEKKFPSFEETLKDEQLPLEEDYLKLLGLGKEGPGNLKNAEIVGNQFVSDIFPDEIYTIKKIKKDENGQIIYTLKSKKRGEEPYDFTQQEFREIFQPRGMYTHQIVGPKNIPMEERDLIRPEQITPIGFDYNVPSYYGQTGALGYGIKRRGRPRGAGITAVRPPNFVGFGINEVNRKNLEKGILTIRRNTRTNYPDMPSRRITPKLQNIIKTIIGGGVPKYEELGNMDNDEKEYLYKLISRSNLEDKLSVPAPSKDIREKDIHTFEILKGQILSGNDSSALVKQFKLLIRKLARQGLLPKLDVEDMMDVLTDLGY